MRLAGETGDARSAVDGLYRPERRTPCDIVGRFRSHWAGRIRKKDVWEGPADIWKSCGDIWDGLLGRRVILLDGQLSGGVQQLGWSSSAGWMVG
jgi:hypothetical protein